MSASWPQSSYRMALTCSARLHHLPQTQALRSCLHWSTGTPLGTEVPCQRGQKCWSSVEGTATRTSASVVGPGAAVRLWAEMTAPTTSSYGGCDPGPWPRTCPPTLSHLPFPCPHTDSGQELFPGVPLGPPGPPTSLAEAFLMDSRWPAGPRTFLTSGCSGAPSHEGGGEVCGLPRTSVPGASTKDTARPAPHRAGEGHVQYWRVFWGQWEG